jgi:predicted nuclease with TOPRIM domain
MADKVRGWLERVLLPQISEVKGELRAMSGRIDGEFKAVHSEIKSVEDTLSTKIEEADRRLSSKIDELDKRMDVTQRLSVVEEQLKELRARR